MTRPERLPASARGHKGSVSVWLAAASFIMIVLVGLAVDLGGQVHAQQRARAVAAQAARVAGEQLQASDAIRGLSATVEVAQARTAAQAYITAAGMTGTVTITGADLVKVDTATTYQTIFLGIIGLNSMTVTGHTESHAVRAFDGSQT